MEQGTKEWHDARLGKVTASRIADVLSFTKKGESVARQRYKQELAKQRLTGEKTEIPTNHHMERGIALEPIARQGYEAKTKTLVTEVGFYDHPTIAMSGASPDGVVGKDGLIEIKCPTEGNHLNTIVSKNYPIKYFPQIQWQLACTNRLWCDFVSFSLDVPEDLQIYIKRIPRDDAFIAEAEAAVIQFLNEVDELVERLRNE